MGLQTCISNANDSSCHLSPLTLTSVTFDRYCNSFILAIPAIISDPASQFLIEANEDI
jgi:hypothetical protein